MQVEMGGLLGRLVSEEVVWYADDRRRVLVYGIDKAVPSSLRVLWVAGAAGGDNGRCVFHSYDIIGGYPALFCRGYIRRLTLAGFQKQHRALKAYVEDDALLERKMDDKIKDL
jgi:hypothetical protein